jgi:hypothetical protein
VEEKSREVVLVIHWAGGRHSELRVKKFATGRSRRCTDPEAIEVLRQMAGKFSDRQNRRYDESAQTANGSG